MAIITIILEADKVVLQQTADFGAFGTQEVSKEITYEELNNLSLDLKLCHITPIVDGAKDTFSLKRIMLQVETITRPQTKKKKARRQPKTPAATAKPKQRPDNLIFMGIVSQILSPSKSNTVYKTTKSYYVESASSHQLIGITKKNFLNAWQLVKAHLRSCRDYGDTYKNVGIASGMHSSGKFFLIVTIARMFGWLTKKTTHKEGRYRATTLYLTTNGITETRGKC